MSVLNDLSRESYRRTLRGKGLFTPKPHSTKHKQDEISNIAKTPVIMVAPTTPIYEAIKIMAKERFRRLPIANPSTKRLEGIVTATDLIDYLGGGKRFEIIQQKFSGNFFTAINEAIKLIMTQNPASIISTARVGEAIQRMKQEKVGGLPIVDEKGCIQGIITERDIVNLFADMISGATVSQLMSERVITALPRATLFEAEKTMTTQGFRRLPIVAEGKLVGIITAMDILRFFGTGEVFKRLQSGMITQVLATPALDIASKDVATIDPNADVGQAARIMKEKNIGAIPVIQNQKLVGILTERDFFKLIEE